MNLRHRVPVSRRAWRRRQLVAIAALTLGAAGVLVPTGSAVATSHGAPTVFATEAQVMATIKSSLLLTSLPSNATPTLSTLAADGDWGGYLPSLSKCPSLSTSQSSETVSNCVTGDVSSHFMVALIGDSRARMLLNLFYQLALTEKFKLLILSKSGCPAPLATYEINNNGVISGSPWPACTAYHSFLITTMKALKPQVIVVSSAYSLELATPTPHLGTAAEVKTDFSAFLGQLPKSSLKVVLGGFPQPSPVSNPTMCLAAYPTAIGQCAFTPSSAVTGQITASQAATKLEGDTFIDQRPYFCDIKCPAVIGNIIPYTADGFHADETYYSYLTGVMWTLIKPSLLKAHWS